MKMKPNRLKRNLIIIFSVIIVFAVTIFVLYMTTDIFRTKRGAFFRYALQIPEVFDVLETEEEYQTLQKTKDSNTYTTNGEMKITSSENIADESILSKINMNVIGKTNNKAEQANYDVSINSDSTELFNMTVARDKNLYGFYSSQIADGYIVFRNSNLTELAQKMNLANAENIPNQIMFFDKDEILAVSKIEKKHIEEYIKIIRNQAPDTSYSKNNKDRIEIEGQKYNTTSYTLKLSSEQNSNLQISLFEKAVQDSIIMNFITSKFKLLNFNNNYTDINTLNSIMRERIEQLKENPELAGEFSITVYEYKQKNIQTKIQINNITLTISNINNNEGNFVTIKIEQENQPTIDIKIENNNGTHTLKIQKNDEDIINSIEFIYNMTGTVAENNVKNHLTINIVDGIKTVSFEYNDTINFTNEVGKFKDMEDEKVAVINDYGQDYLNEFLNTIKNQINNVYITQGASIGINLDPLFD